MRSLSKSRSRSSRRVHPFGKRKHSKRSFGKRKHSKRSFGKRRVSRKHKHSKRSFGKRKLNPKMKIWNKVVKEMGYMKPGLDFRRIPKASTPAGKKMKSVYRMSLKKAGL